MNFSWKELGFWRRIPLRDLWEHKDLGSAKEFPVKLEAHASSLYKLQTLAGAKP